jgi:hypothetical protein
MVAQDAATYSQAAVLKVADTVAQAKAPASKLFAAGLAFNQIAYGAAASLLETQRDALLGVVDGSVTRLRTAADARSLRGLWEGQVALYPSDVTRVKGDLERAVTVVKGAGSGVKALAVETRDALSSESAKAPTAKAGPAPKARASKARKTPVRKAGARKTKAAKVTRKPRVASRA